MEIDTEKLRIYTNRQRLLIPSHDLKRLTLAQIKTSITKIFGYNSQIYLYRQPLSLDGKLNHFDKQVTLDILQAEVGQICATYNNPQNTQQFSFWDPFPMAQNELMLTIQYMQDDLFLNQKYKIDQQKTIYFLTSLVTRWPGDPYINYYTFNIPLSVFSRQETIVNTLLPFCYSNKQLVISLGCRTQKIQIKNQKLLDFTKFYIIDIQSNKIVVDRQADWKSVKYFLQLMSESQLRVKKIEENSCDQLLSKCQVDSKKINLIQVQTVNNKFVLPFSMTDTIFLGTTQFYLLFLQKSNHLHIFSKFQPFEHVNSIFLYSQASLYLDEDLPIINGNNLVMYNITRQAITLKTYYLPVGDLLFSKWLAWNPEYSEVNSFSLDILAFRLKKYSPAVRVIDILNPQDHFMQFQIRTQYSSGISKNGQNCISNRSGVFAIGFAFQVSVCNLYQKSILYTFKISQIKPESILLDYLNTKALVVLQDKSQQYSLNKAFLMQEKPRNKQSRYLYNRKGTLFEATEAFYRNLQTLSQIRIKNSLLWEGQDIFLSSDLPLMPTTYNSITLITI